MTESLSSNPNARESEFRQLACTTPLNRCTFCGSEAQLWQRTEGDVSVKAVCCSNNGDNDPTEDVCPLHMPPECFYHATKREAIEYWQERTARGREQILRGAVEPPAASVIPREPSDEMMRAGLYHSSHDSDYADVHSIWVNMWDKAAGASEPPSDAARDVIAERERQKNVEGWTPEHDDEHSGSELPQAAACYALGRRKLESLGGHRVDLWPWEDDAWKPRDRRRNLVRAGALILAEIERLDRASPTKSDRCQQCDKPLPPLAQWSMPSCPECVEKAERTVETKDRLEHGTPGPQCECGKRETWCSNCRRWTKKCCHPYGTCQCS